MSSIINKLKHKFSANRKDHWEKVYSQKSPSEVSWYQTHPSVSLELIASAGIDHSARIIDVGAGASVLVDKLLEAGYKDNTVLDISLSAIDHAKKRLESRAEQVTWIVTDITEFVHASPKNFHVWATQDYPAKLEHASIRAKKDEPSRQFDLWHDRAVFHFLTDETDRKKYVEVLKESLRLGGHLVLSAFSLEGPPKCSGLTVERYDVEKMQKELGNEFEFIKSVKESHVTPWQAKQEFIYCYFRRK